MLRRLPALACVALLATACGDSHFRPAKGVKERPSQKAAYRVQSVDQESCTSIGFVVRAYSVEAVADIVASHGGTHYRILNDDKTSETETSFVGGQSFGVVRGNARSRQVTEHSLTAEAFACE